MRPSCLQLVFLTGGKPQAEAAARWGVSRDRRRYTFWIKRGLRFSDGTAVTARSFARPFERFLSPDLASTLGTRPDDAEWIVGGRAYFERRARRISGVRATGQKLQIRLTRPEPAFVEILSTRLFCAVPANLRVDPEGVGGPR
ncbi:MAG TPA: ABC transporter substrate-binding protein, partial [Mycobacterium sp.]|nr:ABC transporter substrate-binding protein [Mycobacterium sp.]